MKTISSLLTACAFYSLVYGGQVTKTKSVRFQTDYYTLDNGDRKMLKQFLDSLDYSLDYQFIISGHTDDVGNYTYNDTLSLRRVKNIHRFLLDYGIAQDFITTEHHGEHQPVKPNISEGGRSLNRRVDLVFSYYYFSDAEDLKKELGRKYKTEFIIDPKAPTEFTGPNGVKINIPALAFIDTEGKLVKEKVSITLIEAVGFESFIANDLATVSDGKLLESGGMAKLEAANDSGEELQLAEGVTVNISMPDEQIRRGMNLYYSNDGYNWVKSNKVSGKRKKLNIPKKPQYPQFNIDMSGFLIDSTNKPHRPVKPVTPRYPHEPRPKSFEANIQWYQLPFRKNIVEKHNEWYREAVDTYYDKISKYDDNYAKYKDDMAKYKADLEYYDITLKKWQDAVDVSRKAYQFQMFEIAKEEYDKDVKLYNYKLEKWNEQYQAALDSRDRELDNKGTITTEDAEDVIGRYNFGVDRLGWCNVDMLASISASRINVSVWDNDESEENVLLILPYRKSLFNMVQHVSSPEMYQPPMSIPEREKACVFAFKVESGKPMVYYRDLEENDVNLEMEFETVTYQKFREMIANIYGDRNENG